MKTIVTAIAAAASLAASPAAAQSFVMIIGDLPTTEVRKTAEPNLEQKIETAIERACVKPFIRDLSGWKMYEACRADARAEIDAQLAGLAPDAPVTVAMR